MKVGIIGCGIIGKKRARSLGNNTLKAAADININNAYELAMEFEGVKVFSDYRELLKEDIEIVIVSTTNNMLSKITLDAVKSGKHVLVEKPAAIHYKELEPIIEEAKNYNIQVKVGYNLRFHPAIYEAIMSSHELGEIMFIRANYGHGGRKGYDKEWRANPEISGGGELIDQCVHLLDLAQCFLGDLVLKSGQTKTYFWNMKVDDNAFISVENSDGKVAWLNVSCTEWRNTFSFEIYGKKGKFKIEGLGGSYGTEKLTHYKMKEDMGIPEITTREFLKPDNSFEKEFEHFVWSIRNYIRPESNIEDSYDILKIVAEVYDNC
jgi:predicted dehydrogenase